MSYIDKIRKSVVIYVPHVKFASVAIPHQAFTPREILQQFVVNDVQVMQRQPSDMIGDFGGDVETAADSVMQFEDDFQARNFVRNELPAILNEKRKKSQSKQDVDSSNQNDSSQNDESIEKPSSPSAESNVSKETAGTETV